MKFQFLVVIALISVLACLTGCPFIMIDPVLTTVPVEIHNTTNDAVHLVFETHEKRERQRAEATLPPNGVFRHKPIVMPQELEDYPSITVWPAGTDDTTPRSMTLSPEIASVNVRLTEFGLKFEIESATEVSP